MKAQSVLTLVAVAMLSMVSGAAYESGGRRQATDDPPKHTQELFQRDIGQLRASPEIATIGYQKMHSHMHLSGEY